MLNNTQALIRILILAEYGDVGGTRTYVKQLIDFYIKNRCRVTVMSYAQLDDEMIQYCSRRGVFLVDYDSISLNKNRPRNGSWKQIVEKNVLINFIKKEDPNFLIASVGTPGLFLGYMDSSCRCIYVLHSYPERNKKFIYRFITNIYLKIKIRKNCLILTVSNFAQKKIQDAWNLEQNFKNIKFIYSNVGSVVDISPRPNHYVRVLTVGHVVGYKNPLLWISMAALVLKQMPKVQFVWVGPGPLLEACRKRVADLGLKESISFEGRQSMVAEYYRSAHVYVQPSQIESLGLSVLDAMRHSMPCVVSSRGGLPEVVKDGVSVYIVDIDDEIELAKKVIKLVCEEDLVKKMGEAGRHIYIERFSPERWHKEMSVVHGFLTE